MTLNLTGNRPLATLTAPLPILLELKPAIVNDTNDTIVFPFTLGNVVPNPTSFMTPGSVTYTTTSLTLTTTNGGFGGVRPGDAVESLAHPDDFTGQRVASKSADNNTVTLSALPDANAGSGTSLQFTPPTTDLALFFIRLIITVAGSTLTTKVEYLPVPDGTAIDSDGDGDTSDDIVIANLTPDRIAITKTIDLDSFLTAARVAR